MAGVTLKDVKEISKPGTPLKDTLFIGSANIEGWSSGPADAKVSNGDSESSNATPLDSIASRLNRLVSLVLT